ncbi:MAG: adenylyltransferase/cytidyltransferase family protein [Candidatus Pacebacteria bacterium]|jgi:D-beta-D-heptose 7-phosphate kinase/D-beta-D-heptose 1-phosphate adenosyltransferase|nr:adenylyltransferase/cytidyltransferase family protein [Candidatus Paceibacterota bacterium]MDD3072098.1 adenylyltransferase/cytidyltransferase family protein [Candidatus Paceibacterota bacterium]MDD3728837.1 adenylyltransferase/cytidyltransferase family protein [Candidatus Paceibacterota bacterium]MDD4201304.1 adenylyltransferase/cytidyltransferase family protein [Candidatus Paceibacterota bacterium]MDD4467295.1 adenylyltransferase/cytidyltransferase family protein [Candidatus Paceibacterota
MNKNKIVLDYSKLKEIVSAHRVLGHRIISTAGSWDMLHIGHLRYLIKAKNEGDVLIVGADSDRGIKLYKNELRPVIPQKERMEMLSYQGCVDYVTLIDDIDNNGAWQYDLVKTILPDVFVTTNYSYTKKQINDIKKYSKKVVVLPRQAETTSSTEIIERMVKKHLEVLLVNMGKKKNG